MTTRHEWFMAAYGLSDHLYRTCPALNREANSKWHRAHGDTEIKQGLGTIDPQGYGLCGWCKRVWKARNKSVSDDTKQAEK